VKGAALGVLLLAAVPAAAQRGIASCAPVGARTVTIVDAHHAPSEPYVRRTVATPGYRVCDASGLDSDLPADSTYSGSMIIFVGAANGASVTGTVHGDVIVFGGDLFLRPGATIDGHAIAIGGGVYPSALAIVRGGILPEPGARAQWVGHDTVAVTYWPERGVRPAFVSFPLLFGFRIPSYDRSDGLSIPWGPRFDIDSSRLVFDPMVTYRSALGAWDPSGTLVYRPLDRIKVTAFAARGTFSNDEWSRPTLFNSTATLVTGADQRNYYRSDRMNLALSKAWGDPAVGVYLEPSVGVRDEFDRSVGPFRTGPDSTDIDHGVWSLLYIADTTRIRRVNPQIDRGRIASGIVGLTGAYAGSNLGVGGTANVEVPWESPNGRHYVQTTVDGHLQFMAFTDQQFQFGIHAVVTAGDTAPPQRFTYLGGGATIPTLNILSIGGDELVWGYAENLIPVHVVKIPLLGFPGIGVFATAGAAGVHSLPHPTENIGPRFVLSIAELDWLVDPVHGGTEVSLSMYLHF
jgi:hypothetical protein